MQAASFVQLPKHNPTAAEVEQREPRSEGHTEPFQKQLDVVLLLFHAFIWEGLP